MVVVATFLFSFLPSSFPSSTLVLRMRSPSLPFLSSRLTLSDSHENFRRLRPSAIGRRRAVDAGAPLVRPQWEVARNRRKRGFLRVLCPTAPPRPRKRYRDDAVDRGHGGVAAKSLS